MNIVTTTTNYIESLSCCINDGLLDLGHKVYVDQATPINYARPLQECREEIDLYLMMDTHNYMKRYTNLNNSKGQVPKVMIHTHDMWDDYINAPHSTRKPIPTDGYYDNIMFVRDLPNDLQVDGVSLYPLDYAIESRYVDACSPYVSGEREMKMVFYGTLSTARRQYFLEEVKRAGAIKVEYGAYEFNSPDDKWSHHIYGRYTHDTEYYKALCKSMFCFVPLGAGSSTMRMGESYAAGCISVIQKYPDYVIPYYNFIDGENCLLWSTREELISKLSYYRGRPEEAEHLRKKCYKFGQENMLSRHLAQYILDRII